MGKQIRLTMRKTSDGQGWIYRGLRLDNTASRHAIGAAASWRVIRRGTVLESGLPTLAAAKAFVDARMRKAEEAAERAEWMRKDPEAAEFVAALKDAGVVK